MRTCEDCGCKVYSRYCPNLTVFDKIVKEYK